LRKALLSWLALLVSACSLLVHDELGQVRCEAEGTIGPPACPVGNVCALGRCRECQAVDACGDGVDNDCSGEIDQGCEAGAAGESGAAGGR
jgi:hypothetical protein